jgi:hypothetical protein
MMHDFAIKSYVLFLLLLMACRAFADFSLQKKGERYFLQADAAIIDDILEEIDRREVVALRFLGEYPKTFSGTLTNQTLDELLYRLGVSYLLTYEPDQTGNYRLSDAMMLGSGGVSFESNYGDPSVDFIKLINDLRDDDIAWNATTAYMEIANARCEAVPWLEPVLYDADLQARYAAAQLLRDICPEYEASERLLEVSMEFLRRGYEDDPPLADFIWSWDAFRYLDQSNVYHRVRSRLLTNLQSANRRERLYSALIVAKNGEVDFAGHLVNILAPHLADNDLRRDASLATSAIFSLGKAALPHLHSYRFSPDQQQAELAELICTTLETGDIPAFNPVMYASYTRMPLEEDFYAVDVAGWLYKDFPDDQGRYHNLDQPRLTVQDYYGPWEPSEFLYNPDFQESDKPTDEMPFPYIVKSGETLQSISIKFSVTPEDILALNPNLYPDAPLTPDTKIYIPWY